MRKENRFLYMLKGIACILVIFIHFPMPADHLNTVNALARIAVPVFFIITGRYLYSPNAENPSAQRRLLLRKLLKAAKLTAVVWIVYVLYEAFRQWLVGSNPVAWLTAVLHPRELFTLLLFNSSGSIRPFMWYLFAQMYVYLFAMVSIRWPVCVKQILCAALLLAFLVLQRTVFQFEILGMEFSTLNRNTYRNFLFVGIPFALIGTFIAQADVQSKTNPRVLWILAAAGVLLGVAEVALTEICELPFGMLIAVIALVLLAEHYPNRGCPALAFIGKNLSANVYCWHQLTGDVMNLILPFSLGNLLPFAVTAVVLAISLVLHKLSRRN